jgi:PKD repeat protein
MASTAPQADLYVPMGRLPTYETATPPTTPSIVPTSEVRVMKRFPFFPIIAVILAISCGDEDVMGPGSVALNQTGGEDVTPPTVTAFDFTPTINTTSGPADVTVDFTVTDDLSGAVAFQATFGSPSGAQSQGRWANFGPAGSHTGSVTITFPQYGEAGTWTVGVVRALDAVGNYRYLYTADLVALGFPTELEVVVNEPPVADANGPYSGVEGSAVLLDGSSSTDPNDAIVAYEWDLDNDGDYDDASGVTATTTYADNGWYTVGLRVTDSFGESDTDEAEVTVSNAPPLVDAGPDAVVYSGEWFSQSGSFADPGTDDTHTATVDYGDGSQPLALVDHGFMLNHQYFASATHAVLVTVTDNDGGAGSDRVNVTVMPVPASVDIKPGSYPNCINPRSRGRVAAAVLAGAGLDPSTVDPASVHLEGVAPARWSLNKDVNDDGARDLVLQYSTRELAGTDAFDLDPHTLVLTGRLQDGTWIMGTDEINLAGGTYCSD